MSTQDTVLRLINEHGIAVTLTRTSGGAIVPATGKRVTATVAVYHTHAVPTKDSRDLANALASIGKRKNIPDDSRSFMLTTEVEPKVSDILTVESEKYNVGSIYTSYLKGVPVMYVVQVSK